MTRAGRCGDPGAVEGNGGNRVPWADVPGRMPAVPWVADEWERVHAAVTGFFVHDSRLPPPPGSLGFDG